MKNILGNYVFCLFLFFFRSIAKIEPQIFQKHALIGTKNIKNRDLNHRDSSPGQPTYYILKKY